MVEASVYLLSFVLVSVECFLSNEGIALAAIADWMPLYKVNLDKTICAEESKYASMIGPLVMLIVPLLHFTL
jgi:hypothetical protein